MNTHTNTTLWAAGLAALLSSACALGDGAPLDLDERGSEIVGGFEVVPNGWPAQISLQEEREDGSRFAFCGGTLIREDVVMTAAHCFNSDKEAVVAIAAEHDFAEDSGEEQEQRAGEIVIHPDYNAVNHHNDIALIFLEADFELNANVALAVLAGTEPVDGESGSTTGWGRTAIDEAGSTVLRRVDLNILADKACQDEFPNDDISSSIVCVGPKVDVQSVCRGDSGGPLWGRDADGGLIQTGVTSLSNTQCNSLSVFTSVFDFRDWVFETLEE